LEKGGESYLATFQINTIVFVILAFLKLPVIEFRIQGRGVSIILFITFIKLNFELRLSFKQTLLNIKPI